MIGAKVARVLTNYGYNESKTREEAIDWLETNFDFKIRRAAECGDDNLTFFVPERYLLYVNDYLVNNLGYHFYTLEHNHYDETQVKVRISW